MGLRSRTVDRSNNQHDLGLPARSLAASGLRRLYCGGRCNRLGNCSRLCSISGGCGNFKCPRRRLSLRRHSREIENLTKNSPVFSPLSPIKTNRDVILFRLTNGEVLVVGCDSSGGIGPKPLDKLKVSGFILGKFTARAALMEVLSVGAKLACVVDALGVEPEPTGKEILKGIRDEAKKAGLDPKLAVTGSTEKNIAVEETGIGVTVIGTCPNDQLRIGTARANDAIVAIGLPNVAAEVLSAEKEGKIAETTDVLKLQKLPYVHEIIPVGSTGIKHEIETLASSSNLRVKMAEKLEVDINKSAGPSTVVLAALPDEMISELRKKFKKPVSMVAHLTT